MQTIEEKMKVAVCFTGTGRSLQYTIDNIKKTLIDPFDDCDVFAHLTNTKHVDKLHQYLNFEQVKEFVIEDDIEMPIAKVLNWRHMWPMGLHSGLDPKKTYLNMLRSRQLCGNLLKKYSEENQKTYDMVIFSRLDVEYYTPLPNDLNLENMCLPDFHNHYGSNIGCNDRFAVSNYENMLVYLDAYSSLPDYHLAGGLVHAETTLEWHLKKNQINMEKYYFRFGRVRPDGTRQDERLKNRQLKTLDN